MRIEIYKARLTASRYTDWPLVVKTKCGLLEPATASRQWLVVFTCEKLQLKGAYYEAAL